MREALLLLTHYVGDIHQPLHVGAIYLDKSGKPVNPDSGQFDPATETRGGNEITLSSGHANLHATWDQIPASHKVGKVNAAWLKEAAAVPKAAGPITKWWTPGRATLRSRPSRHSPSSSSERSPTRPGA
jgi:hypothetical protein